MPRQKSTHVDDPKAVGERLREARGASGLSQRRLSFPGCSPTYISRIESGDRIPSLQLLRELGRRLGVSEDYLATGTDRRERERVAVEAEVALLLGELELAEGLYSRMLEEATGDADRAAAQAGLGRIASRRGDLPSAIEHLEAAHELSGQDDDGPSELAASLGSAYAQAGEPEAAIALFEHSLATAKKRGDRLGELHFQLLFGDALIDAGDVSRAGEVLAGALALGRAALDPSRRADAYLAQARLQAARDEPEAAAASRRRALEVLRLSEDTRRTGRAYRLLARVELDRGHAAEALGLLEEGRPLIEAAGSPLEQAQYRLVEARAKAKLGRREEAAALAAQISTTIGDDVETAARSYAALAEVYEELDDHARALELHERARTST